MEKMTRRTARENAFLAAFAASFGNPDPNEVVTLQKEEGEHPVDAFGQALLDSYFENSAQIDQLISQHLKGWTLERIPRVSLVVLRLALSEILYGTEKLPSVAINEAVEITKKFGGEGDHQFVNGLLGSVVRELGISEDPADADGENE